MARYLWLPHSGTAVNLDTVALVEDTLWVDKRPCVRVTFPGVGDPSLPVTTGGLTRYYFGEDGEVLRKWMHMISLLPGP